MFAQLLKRSLLVLNTQLPRLPQVIWNVVAQNREGSLNSRAGRDRSASATTKVRIIKVC